MILAVIHRRIVAFQHGSVLFVDAVADDLFVWVGVFIIAFAEDVGDFPFVHAEVDAFARVEVVDVLRRDNAVNVRGKHTFDVKFANDSVGIAFVEFKNEFLAFVVVTERHVGVHGIRVLRREGEAKGVFGTLWVIEYDTEHHRVSLPGKIRVDVGLCPGVEQGQQRDEGKGAQEM